MHLRIAQLYFSLGQIRSCHNSHYAHAESSCCQRSVRLDDSNRIDVDELHAFTAAAQGLISLILEEPSNNVKTIVLSRVSALHAKHEHILDELVMDILRVLVCPDIEVRRKALGIALEMISGRNVEEVVGFLKKELLRTLDGQFEKVSTSLLIVLDAGVDRP